MSDIEFTDDIKEKVADEVISGRLWSESGDQIYEAIVRVVRNMRK